MTFPAWLCPSALELPVGQPRMIDNGMTAIHDDDEETVGRPVKEQSPDTPRAADRRAYRREWYANNRDRARAHKEKWKAKRAVPA